MASSEQRVFIIRFPGDYKHLVKNEITDTYKLKWKFAFELDRKSWIASIYGRMDQARVLINSNPRPFWLLSITVDVGEELFGKDTITEKKANAAGHHCSLKDLNFNEPY